MCNYCSTTTAMKADVATGMFLELCPCRCQGLHMSDLAVGQQECSEGKVGYLDKVVVQVPGHGALEFAVDVMPWLPWPYIQHTQLDDYSTVLQRNMQDRRGGVPSEGGSMRRGVECVLHIHMRPGT